jgi:hypothetical protein
MTKTTLFFILPSFFIFLPLYVTTHDIPIYRLAKYLYLSKSKFALSDILWYHEIRKKGEPMNIELIFRRLRGMRKWHYSKREAFSILTRELPEDRKEIRTLIDEVFGKRKRRQIHAISTKDTFRLELHKLHTESALQKMREAHEDRENYPDFVERIF